MIFYGTKDYYKHNSAYHFDVCEHCGHLGHLHDHNAIRFFHIYWVPVLPLGKKRILNQCPACKEGHELPLREWRTLRKAELPMLLANAQQGTISVEQAEELVALIRIVGTKTDVVTASAFLLKQFGDDASMLAKIGFLFSAFGMPEEACRTLERSLAIKSSIAAQSLLTKLQRFPDRAARTPARPNKFVQLAPLFALPVLIVLVLLGGLLTALGAQPGHVYLVNGLPEAYTVQVNGTPVLVPALDYVPLEVGYGEVEILPELEQGLPLQHSVIQLEASLWDRLDEGPVFVLNPDAMAFFLQEDMLYVAEDYEGEVTDENQYTYYAGRPFYVFDDIYAAFTSMPENIELSAGRTTQYYSHLEHMIEVDLAQIASVLLETEGPEAAQDYAQRGLKLEPKNEALLTLATSLTAPTEALEILTARLAERPVLTDWHRQYQDLIGIVDPDHDVEAEYQLLAEAEPENNELRYLWGRTLTNANDAVNVFTDATTAPNPSAYAYHALAYHDMIRGNFKRALTYEREALKIQPDKQLFRLFEEDVLLADRQLDTLITRRLALLESEGISETLASSLLFLYSVQGDTTAAGEFIREYLGTLDEYEDEASRQQIAAILSSREEGAQNLEAYADLCAHVDNEEWGYRAAVARMNTEAAAALIDEQLPQAALKHLLLYTVASSTQNPIVAQQHLEQATQLMMQQSTEERQFAMWMRDETPAPELEEVYQITTNPDELPLLLTALGFRFPSKQRLFHQAAQKANYTPRFPGLVLTSILN